MLLATASDLNKNETFWICTDISKSLRGGPSPTPLTLELLLRLPAASLSLMQRGRGSVTPRCTHMKGGKLSERPCRKDVPVVDPSKVESSERGPV